MEFNVAKHLSPDQERVCSAVRGQGERASVVIDRVAAERRQEARLIADTVGGRQLDRVPPGGVKNEQSERAIAIRVGDLPVRAARFERHEFEGSNEFVLKSHRYLLSGSQPPTYSGPLIQARDLGVRRWMCAAGIHSKALSLKLLRHAENA